MLIFRSDLVGRLVFLVFNVLKQVDNCAPEATHRVVLRSLCGTSEQKGGPQPAVQFAMVKRGSAGLSSMRVQYASILVQVR